ncbi:MAG: hypothetical protein EBU90_11595 [Proteobacteria bacterium]|nr:hypothetical protein [Pseudomonadota bacterium]NBP14769.1 hypothetical protein [bacterium]
MFRKDFELLNETYHKKINEFTGSMGIQGDNAPGSGLSPDKIQKVGMPKKVIVTTPINKPGEKNPKPSTITPIDDGENCEECGGACGVEHEDTDSDAYMAKQLVYRIFKLSTMIYSLLVKGGCDQKVEAWVLDKISKAHDNLNSVFGYKDFEDFKKSIQAMGGLYEETEIDLYNALNKGGDGLINALKNILKKESIETRQQVFAEVIKLLDS